MSSDLSLNNFFGRNVSYSEEKHEIYKRLQDDPLSPFKGQDMAEIFVHAAICGFNKDKPEPLEKAKPSISAVAITEEQTSILLAIVVDSTGSVEKLFKPTEASRIIEEYANGGIKLLEDELGGINGPNIAQMSEEMMSIIKTHGHSNSK